MPRRKPKAPPANNDVPAGVVAAILVFLVVVFVPIIGATPDLPSALPPVAFDADSVLRGHARAPRAAPNDLLERAFAAVALAAAQRDAAGVARAQREYASLVIDAAGDAPAARAAIRERHLATFFARLDRGEPDPLAQVAARHGLLGPDAAPEASRAVLAAWFAFRWESVASREALRGESVSLSRVFARLPEPDRRATLAWFLRAECPALLGRGAERIADPSDLARCRAVRTGFVDLTAEFVPGYPVDEARATVEALYARALLATAETSRDAVLRDESLERAREAFEQSHQLFVQLAERDGGRRVQRYLMGTARGMGAN